MSLKLPRVIGHRGACAYAPENTLDSIRAAADLGVKWVEVDVMLTRDNVPVIFHDFTLERTTDGAGNVADTEWVALQELDAGAWFADSFAGTRIPSLEAAVDVILDLGLSLNLEILPTPVGKIETSEIALPTPGREIETAEIALDLLTRCWDDAENILISSYRLPCLETALAMVPEWRRGLLLDDEYMRPDWREVADYLDVATVNISDELATREFVEDIIDAGRMPLVYTINNPQRAKQLFGWGVDALFSDKPDVIT